MFIMLIISLSHISSIDKVKKRGTQTPAPPYLSAESENGLLDQLCGPLSTHIITCTGTNQCGKH